MRNQAAVSVIFSLLAVGGAACQEIHGHVFIGDKSCPASRLIVRLNPPTGSSQPVTLTATDDDGRFGAKAIEGEYYVELFQDTREVYGHVLKLTPASPVEIRLDSGNGSASPCGGNAGGLAGRANSLQFTLNTPDTRDWRPIDVSFDRAAGVLVLDSYGRVTAITQVATSLRGNVLFSLPLTYRPVAIASDQGSVYVAAGSPAGCQVFRYDLASRKLNQRLARPGVTGCGGIAVDGSSVYVALPDRQEIVYWADWQTNSPKSIPVAFSRTGAVLTVDRDSHSLLLIDGKGDLYAISGGRAKEAASLGISANAIAANARILFIASGSKVMAFSRETFKPASVPDSLRFLPSGRYVGITIDLSGRAWVADIEHNRVTGPLNLD